MRRIIIATAALAVLVAAGVATATTTLNFNSYGGSLTVAPSAAGSAAKPSPAGFTEALAAASAQPGLNAAPLVDIKLTLYGLKLDSKDFPTCSVASIVAAQTDTGCPKGSLVASGSIVAAVGPTSLTGPTIPCDPLLHVYNAGGGELTFFFVISGAHQCAGQVTGAAAPYPGTLVPGRGGTLIQNTPLPPDTSTDAANINLYASLTAEHLVWSKATKKVHGKTVSFLSSVGCKAGKRPWSISYTATNGTSDQTDVVKGSQSC